MHSPFPLLLARPVDAVPRAHVRGRSDRRPARPRILVALAIVVAATLGAVRAADAAVPVAAPSSATTTAEITGSGTGYSLELHNNGDGTIARIAFSPAAGVEVTRSGGPGSPVAAPPGGFGRTGLTIGRRQTASFPFATAAPYPVGAGGVLEVAAARGGFTRIVVTGPDAVAESPPPSDSRRPMTAPLPDGDGDSDRVTNERDLCTTTPRGARLVERGCALTDLMVDPTGLLDARRASLQDTRRLLSEFPGLHAGAGLALLGQAMRRLDVAANDLSRDPCRSRRLGLGAATLAGRGLATIRAVTRREQEQVAEQAARVRARRSRRHADADEFTVRLYELESRADRAAETVTELRRASHLLVLACRAASGRGSASGRIESLDHAARVATLSDGTAVHYGAAEDAEALMPGARVKASGVKLGSRVLVAESITASDLKPLNPSLALCGVTWTVAPVQIFDNYQDVLYYDRRGYTNNGGIYLLESGMGIGADFTSHCTSQYSLHVSLKYTTKAGAPKSKLIGVIVNSILAMPAVLPTGVDPGEPATLTFNLYACWKQDCNATSLVSSTTAEAQIFSKGGWGEAIYDRKKFSVADGSATDFDTATLEDGTELTPDSIVYGVGYGIKDGKSTYPEAQFIGKGEHFAVHDDVPDPMKPTGLLWAYIHGTRGGFPYHYWAKLPELVTDVVSFCPGNDNTYYRLPWKMGAIAKVTQGNNGSFTHQGTSAFALDLVMPKGSIGRAARGGRVDWVEETMTKNFFLEKMKGQLKLQPEDVPPNALKIQHQDGSWSWYFHMRPNGVYPHEDDIVKRGQKVIVVGSTGYATGPHLHFQVNRPAGDASMLSRYEVAHVVAPAAWPCTIPQKGGGWVSTNVPGT